MTFKVAPAQLTLRVIKLRSGYVIAEPNGDDDEAPDDACSTIGELQRTIHDHVSQWDRDVDARRRNELADHSFVPAAVEIDDEGMPQVVRSMGQKETGSGWLNMIRGR